MLRGLQRWETTALICAINAENDHSETTIEERLAVEGVTHIDTSPLNPPRTRPDVSQLPRAWELYTRALSVVRKLRSDLGQGIDPTAIDEAQQVTGGIVKLMQQQPEVFLLVHALKTHDEYSFTHSLNVAIMTMSIAQGIGLSGKQQLDLGMAALLHDIGKELVPDEVLNKPGKLTEEEWEVMQRHSVDGTKLLLGTHGAGALATVISYEHQLAYEQDNPDHGRWRLHLGSEMVCVADVYDALRSHRPYRAALPPDVSMRIMEEEAPKKFDATVFAGFRRMLGYYPPGTCVQLSDDTYALSQRSNPEELERPAVLVVLDRDREPLRPPVAVDLAAAEAMEAELSVVQIADPDELGIEPLDYV